MSVDPSSPRGIQPRGGPPEIPGEHRGTSVLIVRPWGVFLGSKDEQSSQSLKETKALPICLSPTPSTSLRRAQSEQGTREQQAGRLGFSPPRDLPMGPPEPSQATCSTDASLGEVKGFVPARPVGLTLVGVPGEIRPPGGPLGQARWKMPTSLRAELACCCTMPTPVPSGRAI